MAAFENFCVNVVAVLDRQGLKKSELARRSGLGRAHFHRILNGQTCPSLDTAGTIAAVLKVPLPFLLVNPKAFAIILDEDLDSPRVDRSATMGYDREA